LRKWSSQIFAEKKVLSQQFITQLNDIPKNGVPGEEASKKYPDFDLQVKIIQLFTLDNYKSEMRVIDASNEIWHCNVFHKKFSLLRKGQYVRIRAGTLL
jgi:hypothetical protein